MVGGKGEAAMDADEIVASLAILLLAAPTCRACSAGVSRVDEDDRHACPQRLVGDEGPQLGERPAFHPRPLFAAELFAVAGNAREFFEGDSRPGVLRLGHGLVADPMVLVSAGLLEIPDSLEEFLSLGFR